MYKKKHISHLLCWLSLSRLYEFFYHQESDIFDFKNLWYIVHTNQIKLYLNIFTIY